MSEAERTRDQDGQGQSGQGQDALELAKAAHNRIDFVEFPAPDRDALRQAQEFYTRTFGWKYQKWGEDYIDTADSGVGSGLASDEPTSAPLAVVYVVDLEHTRKEVERNGGVIVRDIFSFPGGRRFHFKDPAGNELAAWSE